MTVTLTFFGSGAFGLPTLDRLVREHEVRLVVTQPDRPAGRRRRLSPTPVAAFAAAHGLETLKTGDVNDDEARGRVEAAGTAAFVVIAFGQKLSAALLGDRFAINLHASLLPRYRGAAPINWAMINGESETGVSVIRISQRIDAGDVLAQRATPIDPRETAGELEQRLAGMGPRIVTETLERWESGRLEAVPQDEGRASRAPKLAKGDGTVRFDQPAVSVRHRVHGLTPWPGCTVTLEGRRLRLERVEVVDESTPHDDPGRLLGDAEVACASGSVRVLSVQPPGKQPMPFEAYLHGHPPGEDARLEPL